MVFGKYPKTSSTASIWVISSKFIIAPRSAANLNSSKGVSLEENIISSLPNPQAFAIISSVIDEQSTPQPELCKIFKI